MSRMFQKDIRAKTRPMLVSHLGRCSQLDEKKAKPSEHITPQDNSCVLEHQARRYMVAEAWCSNGQFSEGSAVGDAANLLGPLLSSGMDEWPPSDRAIRRRFQRREARSLCRRQWYAIR